ncbi:MAG: fibronectin type III domain-containing protein, partial [Planctomycetaceae bacterium]|nr:fibronectin type III domain-containing protein [Planctomycetaceae bacterium]
MANRYWVASATGNWNDTANWSATSGGTGGASVPGSGDTAILSGNATCLIDVITTVDTITTTGYNGDLVTRAPLTCGKISWSGNKLLLAESQISEISVQRSNANGSKVIFDPWRGASYAPQNFTWTERNGNNMTFQWDPVPNATSYSLQHSVDNGTTWANSAGGSNITNTSYTGSFSSTTNYLIRISAAIPGASTAYSVIPFNRTDPNFSITFVPSTPKPITIGTLQVDTGSNAISVTSHTEARLTGDVTFPGANVTFSLGTGAKLILWGTQDQSFTNGNYLNANVPITLNKPAGILTLTGDISLRSDLLR